MLSDAKNWYTARKMATTSSLGCHVILLFTCNLLLIGPRVKAAAKNRSLLSIIQSRLSYIRYKLNIVLVYQLVSDVVVALLLPPFS